MLLLQDRDDTVTAVEPTWWDRLRAHLHADRLDRDLAAGLHPEGSRMLALRAQALTTTRSRRALAAGLALALADAMAPTVDSLMRIPLNRGAVVEVADEIGQLRGRLLAPGPVAAAGVAQTRILLTVGNGPLRGRAHQHELGRALAWATDALDII
jgi:hypothetical protein